LGIFQPIAAAQFGLGLQSRNFRSSPNSNVPGWEEKQQSEYGGPLCEWVKCGPMAQVLVLYNTPADPAAVDHYYHQTHIPLAHRIPGLRSYVISNGPVQARGGIAPHLVAILHFDSLADLNASLGSPEGQAAADLANFASAGATLLIYDSKAV
jgi:uncharacterized protein (TIGR02118 family)